MRGLANRLRRDEQGVAAVEFALWSVFIFGVLLLGFDFGIYSLQNARLAKSVSEASNFAFATRKAVKPDQVRQYVAASSGLPGEQPLVTVTCNVGEVCRDANRTCACLGAGGAVTAKTCGEKCTSGAKAGYYMTITARYFYQNPIFRNGYLDGAVMVEKSTVQLQ